MTIQQSDLTFLRSALAGSVGGSASGTTAPNGVLNNIFDDISPAELAAGGSQTKKWFVRNDSPTDTLTGGIGFGLWVGSAPTGCTERLGIGFDTDDDADPDMGTMTDTTADAVIEVVSTVADTRQVTLVGTNTADAPVVEVVTLTGTTPVLSVVTFRNLYAVLVSALHGTAVVTAKQGSGGTTRATIPANKIATWLWLEPADLTTAIRLSELAPGDMVGFWDELAWPAAAAEVDPNQSIIALERI